MKKYGLAAMMAVLMLMFLLPHTGQAASSGTKVYLDNRQLTNAEAVLVGGSTMVPIRVLSEELGYQVIWDQKAQQVAIIGEAGQTVLTINQKTAQVNAQSVTLDQPAIVQNSTTYVPLRFVSTQMGLQIKWNNAAKTVYLTSAAGAGGGSVGVTVPGTTTPVTTTPADPASGAAEVNAISFSDNRLMISLSKAVTPQDSVLTGSDRIVVDLPNAKFGAAFGGGMKLGDVSTLKVTDAANVSQVRYSLYSSSPSTVRVVIDLKSANAYKLTTEGTAIFVALDKVAGTPNTSVGGNGKKVIVIDAGHGDQDPGAVGPTGVREKDVNLAIALKLEKILKQNSKIDVVMTRSDDTFLELKERVKVAENVKADVFLSIHHNSGSSSASGTETYYQRADSKSLATTLHKYLVAATGFKDRKVQYGNFHVIRETTMPASLVEVGFVSNAAEAAQIRTDAFQQKVAEALAKGLLEYLGL
ncbi:N-acetylmuramoyl-L-alanine amidase family protein [Saccharibacillus sp. CPCC 101409]|uniref:N-acetylmuramoyl-L-alanine amidase family protein n=1 Tax=Saccharibacillus sp. CPCC 101409 TaxID=3058041 RepID=UPI00267238A4|nr:N-acetylmuramoyl-L-alanine amidase family protein [Saccharibacillus sp. CPCC 101409]MDO3409667.1 N-acetylmuramoyl-L-alanine amidase family protein [Saccharibacillus sp. CPCC 101409]